MVIVPDPTDDNEFITIILDKGPMKKMEELYGTSYSFLHKKRINFQTDARPGKRYLYLHALLTLFRRRRYNVPGWVNDRNEVLTGRIWATPKEWGRKSIIEALAAEFGETWEGIEIGEALTDFPDAKPVNCEKDMATVVRYSYESRDARMQPDDFDELEFDSD
ncbi:hypothetical protein CLAIMM_15127 [Cladophialophora immunda]|nr:hypothetical protein CLAIMM_15127 [Cladophialophora immunda]